MAQGPTRVRACGYRAQGLAGASVRARGHIQARQGEGPWGAAGRRQSDAGSGARYERARPRERAAHTKGAREEGQRGRGRSGRGDGVAGRRNLVREVRWFGRRRARAGRQAGAAERRRGRTRGRAGEAVAVVAVSGISGGGCWRHRAVRARVPGRVWRRAGRRGARQRTHARCEGVRQWRTEGGEHGAREREEGRSSRGE